jgi:protein-disulfide isomerase
MTVEPEIIRDYVDTGQVRLVFRPVLDLGQGSAVGAEAAYCAGEQGAGHFWAMHDLLFERQRDLFSNPDLRALTKEFAAELGLDATAYADCIDRSVPGPEIVGQDQTRREAGIRQRPTFRISGPAQPEGRLVPGAQSFATFRKLIAQAAAQ